MKSIMVLGAGIYQLPILQAASKMCRVILVAPTVSKEFAVYADKIYYLDLRRQEEIAEIAEREQIDGIITDQTDIPVRAMAYVADKLGLSGNAYETAQLFTDKGKMRGKLQEIGIPVLPNKIVVDVEDAICFFKTLHGDAIMKPVDNQGSRGVYRVGTVEGIKRYFPDVVKASASKQVLIEKYVSGREFVVEAMSLNYDYCELILGDTEYFNVENAFAAKTRIFPSLADKQVCEQVLELNKKIIKGFGLKQGISHSEYIMDGDKIYLIETAARGGGVFISSDLISLSTGLDTEKFLIKMALGEQKELPLVEKQKCHCGYMAFYLPEGTVQTVNGVKEVQQFKFVHRNILDTIQKGMEIGTIKDKTSRFSIIVSGATREELLAHMEKIRQTLYIEVKTVNGIGFPIWD